MCQVVYLVSYNGNDNGCLQTGGSKTRCLQVESKASLSAGQIAQYQRDGAILLRGFLTDEELALLAAGLEESYANPGKRFSRMKSDTGEGETFLETFPSQNSPSLRRLLAIGRIPEVAARMMECPSAQLILDQVFYKKKGCVNPTPWHQDTPFLRVRGDQMIRVWLSCDPSPRQLTLQIVRGSHRWNVVYNGIPPASDKDKVRHTGEGKLFNYVSEAGNGGPPVPDIAQYRDSFDILTWDVEPGDALIFNGNMLHAAGGMENSPHHRRAYATMWGGPDLLYIDPPENAIPTLADINGYKVPSGSRVGDYREAFPIGWESDRTQ